MQLNYWGRGPILKNIILVSPEKKVRNHFLRVTIINSVVHHLYLI